jgi:hypothetical protein
MYGSSSETLKCTECCNKPGRDPIVAVIHQQLVAGRHYGSKTPPRPQALVGRDDDQCKTRVYDRVDTQIQAQFAQKKTKI